MKKIFLINIDSRDIFRKSFFELMEKLERDRLAPEVNSFFVFSWSTVSYEMLQGLPGKERFTSIHKKAVLGNVLRAFLYIRTIFTVLHICKKHNIRPDAWFCHDFGFVPALWIVKKVYGGKLAFCFNNQPVIYSRTRKFGQFKAAYSWVVERVFSPLPDLIFTINETMRQYILRLGIPESKIKIFSVNTIERDKKYIVESKPGLIREKYKIPPETKIVITAARMEAEKNYPELLRLFAGLGPGYVLIAMGHGSLMPVIKELANTLGISDRVIFTGFVERDMIWNYYRDADVFILLSKAEALGMVFWESMYVDVPVIGSEVDGIIETVGTDESRGRIWRPSMGQKGFTELVSFATTPSEKRTTMIEKARKYVEEQLNNRKTINDYL
jgi:glycosyltransferase involved in cell wall biosynthesis